MFDFNKVCAPGICRKIAALLPDPCCLLAVPSLNACWLQQQTSKPAAKKRQGNTCLTAEGTLFESRWQNLTFW
jgi:hypothetical protein